MAPSQPWDRVKIRWQHALFAVTLALPAVSGKQYLDDRYKPRTVRHSNAVLRSFYEFWMDRGAGPVINPVQLDRRATVDHRT